MARGLGRNHLTAVVLAVTGLGMALHAEAQSAPRNTISSEGTATVDAAPNFAGFWLHKTVTGASMAEATRTATGWRGVLSERFKSWEGPPKSIEVSDVSIADATQPIVKLSAYIKFDASRFAAPDEGPQVFARLCDDLLAVAKEQGAQLEGPVLGLDAPETLEQAAVARAMEQALPPAAGAAAIMRTQIASVESVEILSIAWNRDFRSKAPQPQVRRVTCTARVKVTYTYGVTGG